MEIFYQPQKKENLSLALGFFDGIHLGHKKVIENAVNFAKENYLADDEYFSVLSAFIAYKFSFPISNKEDYLETQFISEYVKLKGYQGIRYKSSLNRNGHNIVFFDYEDCKTVNSFPYKLDEITYKERCTFPMGKFDYENDLIVTNKENKV